MAMKNGPCFVILLSFLAVVCTGSRDPTIATGEKRQVLQTWCIAKPGLTDDQLIDAKIKYCNEAGVNCDAISQDGPCYEPNTLVDHASYAVDSYYALNNNTCPSDYGFYTVKNPSHGSCIFP